MVPSLASERKMSFMRPPSGCSSLQLGSDGLFVLAAEPCDFWG